MARQKLLLYSPVTGSRLRYIALHLAGEILGAQLIFTGDLNEARSADLPLINYSASRIAGAVNIIPHGLLDEKGICHHDIDPAGTADTPVLFRSSRQDDTGFDPFAASFYLLSRYEEYLPFKKDDHGRFPFKESMACKYSFAEEPLVELWADKLKDIIKLKYPAVSFPEREFSFIPTIDIDIPWAYKNRGFWRTAGGFARSLLKSDREGFISRQRALFKGGRDPYDTFGFIEKIHNDYGFSPLFFFSAGTYGRFDKCISPSNSGYHQLIVDISRKYGWGIHPSYLSYGNPALLRKEMERIAVITGKAPFRSRQHYLRFSFPDTCRMLIDNDITEDYTMGWPEVPGFRAGTCTPFMFYDLEKEESTTLKIYPFQIMDGALCDYMKLQPEQATGHALRIVKKVRDSGGTLITLWHNASFSDSGRWEKWKNVYFEIIKSAAQ